MGAVDWKSLILSPREPLSEDLGAGCLLPVGQAGVCRWPALVKEVGRGGPF